MKEIFEKLSAERCPDGIGSKIAVAASVFGKYDEIDENNLYLTRFGRIPNRFRFCGIDSKKANEWLLQNYQDEITDCFFTRYDEESKNFNKAYYFLFDDLLIYLGSWGESIFLYRKTDNTLVNKIISEIKKFKERKKSEINLLVMESKGLSTSVASLIK